MNGEEKTAKRIRAHIRAQMQEPLRGLVDRIRIHLQEDDIQPIEEFIEYHEFECAIDLLVATLAIRNVPLDQDTFDRIHSMVNFMKLKSVTKLDELKVTNS